MKTIAPWAAGTLLATCLCLAANPIDRDGDGFSDIWQSRFQSPTLNPNGDPDGDGYPNAEEETAGTNPFDANSFPQIREFIHHNGNNEVSFLVDTLKGKQYAILAEEELEEPEPWDLFLPFFTSEINGPQFFAPGPVPVPYPNHGFFRLRIQDIDADGDGLTAHEECLLGTSDKTPNSSGNPREDDCQIAEKWLDANTPGINPGGVQDNLSALSLAHLQSDTIGQTSYSLLVTATGSDTWHQLTSWNLSGTNSFTELRATPPIQGILPQVHALPHTNAQTGRPRFLTTTIRPDGALWLSSRSLDLGGAFTHHHSLGYGPQLGLTVLNHAVCTRLLYDGQQQPFIQIVTPIVVDSSFITKPLRVLVWHLDLTTGVISAQDDSGELLATISETSNNFPTSLTASHLGENSFVFTSRNGGALGHTYGIVTNTGHFIFNGMATRERSIDGKESRPSLFAKTGHDTIALNASGYLTSQFVEYNSAPEGEPENLREELVLSVYERRPAGPFQSEPQKITDHREDHLPDLHGVIPTLPVLHDSTLEQASANDRIGRIMASGDFDNNGHDDLAIGIPSHPVTRTGMKYENAGEVIIYEGRDAPLAGFTEPDFVFNQDTPGITSFSEEDDFFGNALATGDFNGDGYDDLAISATSEETLAGANATNSGVVQILWGSNDGLTAINQQNISQESFGQTSRENDYFGLTLASGDLNGDGYDDLVIACPYREVDTATDAGVVYRAWGTATGLNTSSSAFIHQNVANYPETAQDFDLFGLSLAVGDFNGSSPDDLAIGIPYEDTGNLGDTGGVQIVYGDNGFIGDVGPYLTQGQFPNGADIPGTPEAGDRFGWSLVAADFTGDGRADLAIGVPQEDNGSSSNSGAVNILYGSNSGINSGNALLLTQENLAPGSILGSEDGDRFGFTLAAGDLYESGYASLVIGIPYENLNLPGEDDLPNTGALFIVEGGPSGLRPHTSVHLTEATLSHESTTSHNLFAQGLLLCDPDGDGDEDLFVGIPGDSVNNLGEIENAGTIAIFPGYDTNGDPNVPESSSRLNYLQIQTVRALLSDVRHEQTFGAGLGTMLNYNAHLNLPEVHIASCTKVMTLLIAVKAIEEGLADFDVPIEFSERAGETNGSNLKVWEYANAPENHTEPYPPEWDQVRRVLDDDGKEIPFFKTGDEFRFEMLLHAMMMESCNRSSVAIAEYVSQLREGNPNGFLNLMMEEGNEIGMTNTLWGHPAGGCITNPQEMINLVVAGWEKPLFRQIMGAEIFGFDNPFIRLSGTDQEGTAKSNAPFEKFTTIGLYPGRQIWKGGNGRLWWSPGSNPEGVPQPEGPRCTSSALAIVERLNRPLAIAVQQTGSRTSDSQDLLTFGFRKIFTPDKRGETGWPGRGGITIEQPAPLLTSSAALSANRAVVALIDGHEKLKLVLWDLDAHSGSLTAIGNTEKRFSLLGNTMNLSDHHTELVDIPTTRAQKDLLEVQLENNQLELKLWRIDEK